jgi:hypothetical protein
MLLDPLLLKMISSIDTLACGVGAVEAGEKGGDG